MGLGSQCESGQWRTVGLRAVSGCRHCDWPEVPGPGPWWRRAWPSSRRPGPELPGCQTNVETSWLGLSCRLECDEAAEPGPGPWGRQGPPSSAGCPPLPRTRACFAHGRQFQNGARVGPVAWVLRVGVTSLGGGSPCTSSCDNTDTKALRAPW